MSTGKTTLGVHVRWLSHPVLEYRAPLNLGWTHWLGIHPSCRLGLMEMGQGFGYNGALQHHPRFFNDIPVTGVLSQRQLPLDQQAAAI